MQHTTAKAGYNEQEFAGHSLRAGFLTSAAGHGASIFKMIEVSRHKSLETVKTYVRDAELFKDHAGEGFL
jgi:site-specific recombinase XerD